MSDGNCCIIATVLCITCVERLHPRLIINAIANVKKNCTNNKNVVTTTRVYAPKCDKFCNYNILSVQPYTIVGV